MREKGRDLTQSYDKSPYTSRNVKMAKWQHKNATKKFDYTAVADRLWTVSWSNYGHPTGVVNINGLNGLKWLRRKKCQNASTIWIQSVAKTTLLPTSLKIALMHSVCLSMQSVWRSSSSKEEPFWGTFCPAMDPPLDGPGRKTTTLVGPWVLHTKLREKFNKRFWKRDRNCEKFTPDFDERRQTDGRHNMTIAHLSLWLKSANQETTQTDRIVSRR